MPDNNSLLPLELKTGSLEKSQERVEKHLEKVDASISKQAEDNSAIAERVTRLESYWFITLALAAIFGIGGGWILLQLHQVKEKSEIMLRDVKSARNEAVNDITAAQKSAIDGLTLIAKEETNKSVRHSFSALIKSGLTQVGGLNGNHRPSWRDHTIRFTDENGKAFVFETIPRVIVSADGEGSNGYHAWSVTVMKVTTTDFTVRVRSVDELKEGNYGWNGSAGVQWVAFVKPK